MTDTVVEQSPDTSISATGSPAEIEALTSQVLAEINKGTMTLSDLLKALSPKQESEPVPAVLPTAKAITPAQQAEIDKMPTVFGRVVPTERRALEPVEVSALVEEKQTLDTVKKTAEARLKDITVTVHNHLDVVLEESGATEGVLRDGSGHYIAAGKAGAPDQEQEFSREVKNYAASLSEEGLANAEALGLCTHEEYLAMTRQVRVVDEARLLAAVTKNPALVHAVRHATAPGKQGTAVALRKRK